MIKKHFRACLVAVQFLSQIPVTFRQYPEKSEVTLSLAYYPWVGFLLAAVLCIATRLFQPLPEMMAVSMLLTLWVWLTGALHIDGLADSADAWLGGQGSTERTLAIMKDPASGPVAVVIVVLMLLMKFCALLALWQMEQIVWLLPSIVLARLVLPILLMTTPYVRAQGLGSWLVDNMPTRTLITSTILALTVLLWLYGWLVITLLAAVAVVFWQLRRLMVQRIGGVCGDTAGALVEITELVCLLMSVVILLP